MVDTTFLALASTAAAFLLAKKLGEFESDEMDEDLEALVGAGLLVGVLLRRALSLSLSVVD